MTEVKTPPVDAAAARFSALVKEHELKPQVAKQLWDVLNKCEIVMLCDDSGSMKSEIVEPLTGKKTTRWMELKRLAKVVIDYVTAINPNGLDLYFLNRTTVRGVNSSAGLQEIFAQQPDGETHLLQALRTIYCEKSRLPPGKQLLVVVITDGVPTDGNHAQLGAVIRAKPSNTHVSFAECTDRPEDMEYLDEMDREIPNFDNTASYPEELQKVHRRMGATYKFTFEDYVIKILLATFVRSYFLLDQPRTTNDDCCVIL